jgi:hypothetical protein
VAIVAVNIRGISPLLQHAFGAAFENEDATRTQVIRHSAPREQAEAVTYRDDDRNVYFPGASIARMLRESGTNHKLKGSRRSVKFVVPSAVLVPEDHIHILTKDGERREDFEVDSRPVTIPSTKGRIMRHRPRWDDWTAEFSLEIDPSVLPVDLVHQLLEEGGRRVGIGDYRPEKGGPFGRFEIVSWSVVR